MVDDTDRELVRRVQAGDRTAFDLLFTRYQHRICSLVARHIDSQAEVEDVAQEAFIRAFRGLARFRGDSSFHTWLYRIAVNTARNHRVARARRPPAFDVDAEEAQFMEGAGRLRDAESPEAAAARDELSRAIDQAIAQLPGDLRSAISLREFDGLSYSQIADIMDCPVGTVRSRIFRAREAVNKCIGPLLG